LFDRETKGTLRQALAAMWDAERHLRVAHPHEALAPENRALEIIKALQQADRAYVQRVGFEAAPIDFAGRRLRGDVDDVPAASSRDRQAPGTSDEQHVREVLRLAPWRGARASNPEALEALRRVEPLVAKAAIEQPDVVSLGALEELRRLAAGELPDDQRQPSEIETALLRMLPAALAQPARSAEPSAPYAEAFFRNLEGSP
jgi:hypothetical protein